MLGGYEIHCHALCTTAGLAFLAAGDARRSSYCAVLNIVQGKTGRPRRKLCGQPGFLWIHLANQVGYEKSSRHQERYEARKSYQQRPDLESFLIAVRISHNASQNGITLPGA